MLNLSGIVSDSIVDGPGIRTTVFCQGCPHHCPGCHNPETWEFGCGTDMDEETIVEIVRSNPLCRGVTFSGGEPFAQAAGYAKLAKLLKEAGYEVAAYSGFTFEQLLNGTPDQKKFRPAKSAAAGKRAPGGPKRPGDAVGKDAARPKSFRPGPGGKKLTARPMSGGRRPSKP
jgi:organic radical activating enzyme